MSVRLGSRSDNFLLRISDDGCGFGGSSGKTAGTGLGMRTMGERAGELGASLRTRRGQRGGAEVDVVAKKR